MERIKPYRGNSLQRLAVLIRTAQTPSIPSNVELFIGPTQDTGDQFRNTEVMVSHAFHTGVTPEKRVTYQRLELEGLKDLPFGELIPFENITFPTTTHAILDKINKALGINLTADEVVDESIEELPVNGVTLKIKPGSYAWLPGEHKFGFAPKSPTPAARGNDLRIPTDENGRLRILETSA